LDPGQLPQEKIRHNSARRKPIDRGGGDPERTMILLSLPLIIMIKNDQVTFKELPAPMLSKILSIKQPEKDLIY
jgi:hypothetical protein